MQPLLTSAPAAKPFGVRLAIGILLLFSLVGPGCTGSKPPIGFTFTHMGEASESAVELSAERAADLPGNLPSVLATARQAGSAMLSLPEDDAHTLIAALPPNQFAYQGQLFDYIVVVA